MILALYSPFSWRNFLDCVHAAIIPPKDPTSPPWSAAITIMQSVMSAGESMKEQVVDTVPKRIKELKFGVPYDNTDWPHCLWLFHWCAPSSSQDIVNQSVLEVCDRDLYATDRNLYAPAKDRRPASNGPLDLRLGISSKTGLCETCGESLVQCNGHFGLVKLALPAFHVGYLKMVISVLQNICKVRNLFDSKLSELMTVGLFSNPSSRKGTAILPERLAPAKYW